MRCDPAELKRMMKEGAIDALDRITRCFGEHMLNRGLTNCRTREDADDAVQDALLAAGVHMTQYRGDGPVEAWLVRMVANACHRMKRGRRNAPHVRDAEDILMSEAATPEETAMVGQLTAALGEALLDENPENRAILILADGHGYSGREIADELDLSQGAVRVRLSRTRAKIRERFEKLVSAGKPTGNAPGGARAGLLGDTGTGTFPSIGGTHG